MPSFETPATRFLAIAAALLLVPGALAACGDDGGGMGDDDDDLMDGGAVGDDDDDGPFTEEGLQAFMNVNCAGSPCHIGFAGGPAAGMNLTDFPAATIDVPAVETSGSTMLDRIEPGDHTRSYLFHKINGSHQCPEAGGDRCDGLPAVEGSGARMPLNNPVLDDATIDRIAGYIDGL